MSDYITVVIRYKKDDAQPMFKANMEVLGGIVDSVMFDDALMKLQNIEDAVEAIKEGDV